MGLASLLRRTLREDEQTQLEPLGQEECFTVASLKDDLKSSFVLALQKSKGQYTLVIDDRDKNIRCSLIFEQKYGSIPQLVPDIKPLLAMSENAHSAQGVLDSCMASGAFSPYLGGSCIKIRTNYQKVF